MKDLEKYVSLLIEIANDDSHGYDQGNRYSPNFDCSSLVAHCLIESGFNVSRYSRTATLKNQLIANGFTLLSVNDKRQKGDIFLTENKHVVTCVDSNRIVHARLNENEEIIGGKTGDQTGREICIDNFYVPSYGWEYHLRYTGNVSATPITEVRAKEYAQYFNKTLSGTYEVSASWLNVRNGCGKFNSKGTENKILTSIPTGTKVRCYGYYSLCKTVIWLYVQFTYKGVKYTGFVNHLYLEKEKE